MIQPGRIFKIFFRCVIGLIGLAVIVFAQNGWKTIPQSAAAEDKIPAAQVHVNDLGMTFVWIEPGTFFMGSPPSASGRDSDETYHKVILTRGYYLQTTEVTQGQWEAVMGSNPSHFKNCGDNCPVENVSWNDTREFIRKLNSRGDRIRYRLPTEAEWEFAARDRGESYVYVGSDTIDEGAWYDKNSSSKTHPVGLKKPNRLDLFDMSGNVWEWCEDGYEIYRGYSLAPVTDPSGRSPGDCRVLRGGGWNSDARYCRSAYRGKPAPSYRDDYIGFRLAGR